LLDPPSSTYWLSVVGATATSLVDDTPARYSACDNTMTRPHRIRKSSAGWGILSPARSITPRKPPDRLLPSVGGSDSGVCLAFGISAGSVALISLELALSGLVSLMIPPFPGSAGLPVRQA
jgi:hypothetical protein